MLRKLLPDALLVLGFGCIVAGAYAFSPFLAVICVGLALVALGVWMGA